MDDAKKLISVAVPIYNEVSMVEEICSRIESVLDPLDGYVYEIVFFDDGSTDGTKRAIEKLCGERDCVKGVFYSGNFGYLKNTFYCVQQAKGDCAVIVHADLQNPPELIPEFIKKWENGAQVVQGVKTKSRENKFMFFLRSVFYFMMIVCFGVNIKAHATEFVLLDRSFVEVLKGIHTNTPFLRGIIREYASSIDYLAYTQDARKKGKSKFNLSKYYDFAICGVTQYSRVLPRRVIVFSLVALLLLLVELFVSFIPNAAGLSAADLMDSILLRLGLAGLCLFVILVCIIFEYLIAAIQNTTIKPLVVEEKRIGY